MRARYGFVGRIDNVSRTSSGGILATANLTRTGIFEYHTADGPFFELRPAEEVFAPASLETLKGAPLTIGHPPEVNVDNWRELAVGHVGGDVRPNGQFVTASLYIQDADACSQVEQGILRELSCGYECELDVGAGEDPEFGHYDAIQRNPRYNHVAMGGTDWGRAGRDVRILGDVTDPAVDRTTSFLDTGRGGGADFCKGKVDAAVESPVERARREMLERHAGLHRRR